jgi:predicted RNase H-like HicB family nuclease
MPRHYLAVLVPMADRTWRAHLPDFPTCGADGSLVESLLAGARAAASRAAGQLVAQGVPLPTRRSYEAIRSHSAWATERGVDWNSAVICIVDLKIDE